MLAAIGWPLVVVMVWAGLFITTLAFAQRSAHMHDQDSTPERRTVI